MWRKRMREKWNVEEKKEEKVKYGEKEREESGIWRKREKKVECGEKGSGKKWNIVKEKVEK